MSEQQGTFNPSIDTIIAKFVPIVGALMFITGFGYLIYTSVWEAMTLEFRLGLGFFASVLIIGTGFSLSDKLKYFADVVIGGGILLLFGTLIYGSRTTELATSLIPEQATLITAIIFTCGVSYLSALRKSKVILVLGLLGAYLIPFVIGQNGVWASNISFNAYLIYFIAVNMSVLFVSRDMSIYDIIPANIIGLFISTFSLYSLTFADISSTESILTSENVSIILLAIIVIASAASIVYTSRFFSTKEDTWISLGYLVPLLWFMLMSSALTSVDQGYLFLASALISCAYFSGWYLLGYFTQSRTQHIALYIGGIIALVKAIFIIFPEFNFFIGISIAYISLVFLFLYTFIAHKFERILAAGLFSFSGALISLIYIHSGESGVELTTFWSVISLIPAILLGGVVRVVGKETPEVQGITDVYSGLALILAIIIIILEFILSVNPIFIFFILPGFLTVLAAYFQKKDISARTALARGGSVWLTIGFFPSFFILLSSLIPGAADGLSFFRPEGFFINNDFMFAIFAAATYYLALNLSRVKQVQKNDEKPSFLLVISFYTTLLLLVNFMIIIIFNDIGVAQTTGGLRAIATTLWWTILSVFMLYIGVKRGGLYTSEKSLGIILLGLTVVKIIFYDMASMDMDKKIIVLMVAGGIIMMFSYFLQSKGLLKNEFSKK
ncbi:DUF2339 domain-containing protein [Candidatus Gracilibacteria bacterium]|nr:DUF2339 domain-containing protein [Candidatus Gracilibacteria bacterium]